MFQFNGLDHLNIRVNNLNKSLNFYKKLFNFEVKEKGFSQMSGLNYAIVGISNKAMLCMYEDPSFDSTNNNLSHIGFNIDYKEDMINYLKENNIKINYYHKSGITNYPKSQSIYIEDPSGYEIELSNNFGGGL